MSDISQTELLESNNDSVQMKLHTQLPARVVSFNANDQTVSIELLITQMDYDGNALSLPPLVDVPVWMLCYGSFNITSTPAIGDEGLAHFAERCIDGWFESGRASVPLDIRFHDLSDAFFMPGYKSKPNALTIIPNAMHIGTASAYIRIFENGTIELNGTAFEVNAPTTLKQGLTVIGDSTSASGDFIASGISLKSHTHNGVQSGSSNTGLPQ